MNLPAGDGWDVQANDFIQADKPTTNPKPTILVGNPPFKEYRSLEGRRSQVAMRFLERYLELLEPGGLLGIILPETFLENSSCKVARRRLLIDCDLLELWHMPEGIFPLSNAAAVVVLAKKLRSNGVKVPRMPVRVERVSSLPDERRKFLNEGLPRFSYVVPSSARWLEDKVTTITTPPLERSVWDHLEPVRRLGEVAHVRNGIIPGPNKLDHFSDDRLSEEWRPWIPGAKSFEPYLLTLSGMKYVRYPGELLWPRRDLEYAFGTPFTKVFVNSARAPGNPWRIYSAIDEAGYFPSQNMHCVIPEGKDVSLQELVGLFNSPIASAWIDGRNRRRWIGEQVLRDMPFPDFSEAQKKALIGHVNEIMTLKRKARQLVAGDVRDTLATIRQLVHLVDQIIFDAFALSRKGREELQKLFAGYPRPGFEWADIESSSAPAMKGPSEGQKWVVTGQVVAVDTEVEKLTMWVRGYNDSQPFEASISESMPGWILREEAAFQADLPWETRHLETLPITELTAFRPLDFSYLSSDELKDLLKDSDKLNRMYTFDDGPAL
jgi:hypothetical protein